MADWRDVMHARTRDLLGDELTDALKAFAERNDRDPTELRVEYRMAQLQIA